MNLMNTAHPDYSAVPDVMLLTRADCHLCQDAVDTVARVCSAHEIVWREVTAEEDPALGEQFTEEMPVLFIDGVQRDFWQIDPDRLARLIDDARRGS